MTRRRPSASISPQQLKAFAVATVLMTGLLAMVAGGEDAGIAAQVQARQAKNDLIAQEQKSFGTKKIVSNLAIREGGSSFGNDDGGDSGGDFAPGGSGSSARIAPVGPKIVVANDSGRPRFPPPTGLKSRPNGKYSRQSLKLPGDQEGGGGQNQAQGSGPPDLSQIGAAVEASRQRSGSGGANGD